MPPGQLSGVQSLERAFGLLDLIAGHHATGLTLAQAQQCTGLDRTTVHRMLSYLTQAGYVQRMAGGERPYTLGCRSMALGLSAFTHPPLVDALRPLMKKLARRSGDNVFLVIRLGDFSYTLHLEQGSVPMPRYPELVGASLLLGLGTGSMALLAALPDPELCAHLARHQATYSANQFSPLRMQRAIQRTRQLGYTLAAEPGVAGAGYAWNVPQFGNIALSILSNRARMPVTRRHELARMLIDEVGSHPGSQPVAPAAS